MVRGVNSLQMGAPGSIQTSDGFFPQARIIHGVTRAAHMGMAAKDRERKRSGDLSSCLFPVTTFRSQLRILDRIPCDLLETPGLFGADAYQQGVVPLDFTR